MTNTRAILLIEDDTVDSKFYQQILAKCKPAYKIFAAKDGQEGIELFKKHPIDCAVIDYNLPGMNGLEILEELKERSPHENIATIILTGVPEQKIQAEAARKGALDYIVKNSHTTPEKVKAVIDKTIKWAEKLNSLV